MNDASRILLEIDPTSEQEITLLRWFDINRRLYNFVIDGTVQSYDEIFPQFPDIKKDDSILCLMLRGTYTRVAEAMKEYKPRFKTIGSFKSLEIPEYDRFMTFFPREGYVEFLEDLGSCFFVGDYTLSEVDYKRVVIIHKKEKWFLSLEQ